MPATTSRSRGFTLVELLVVIFIIAVIVALLLPATRSSRESARRMSCSNNVKNLALALHNYHEQHGQFPMAMGGTDENAHRLSGWIAILPFIEQGNLWNQINAPLEIEGVKYPAMGVEPWKSEYPPWATQPIPLFRCPSSPHDPKAPIRKSNYAFSIGDAARDIHQPQQLRGAFGVGMTSSFADFKDGGSNTILLAEIGSSSGKDDRSAVGHFLTNQPAAMLQNPSLCLKLATGKPPQYASDEVLPRGARWCDGAAGCNLFNTILPPNSPSCAVGGTEGVDGFYSAGSEHGRGVMVARADGSTAFIDDDIDTGDLTRPAPTPQQLAQPRFASPYGVWGALGTITGEENADR